MSCSYWNFYGNVIGKTSLFSICTAFWWQRKTFRAWKQMAELMAVMFISSHFLLAGISSVRYRFRCIHRKIAFTLWKSPFKIQKGTISQFCENNYFETLLQKLLRRCKKGLALTERQHTTSWNLTLPSIEIFGKSPNKRPTFICFIISHRHLQRSSERELLKRRALLFMYCSRNSTMLKSSDF